MHDSKEMKKCVHTVNKFCAKTIQLGAFCLFTFLAM